MANGAGTSGSKVWGHPRRAEFTRLIVRFRYLEMLGGSAGTSRGFAEGDCEPDVFLFQGAMTSVITWIPAAALSILLCTRSTSKFRNFCSSWSSEFKRANPSTDLELNRAMEGLIPSTLFPTCELGVSSSIRERRLAISVRAGVEIFCFTIFLISLLCPI
jgi:hypothetical protein